jgi:hypothetical protein
MRLASLSDAPLPSRRALKLPITGRAIGAARRIHPRKRPPQPLAVASALARTRLSRCKKKGSKDLRLDRGRLRLQGMTDATRDFIGGLGGAIALPLAARRP